MEDMLAIEGGRPVRNRQFQTWPFFSNEEISAVGEILRSGKVNYWTGDEGRLFEQDFARFVGVEHAVAVMNGSVALEAALYALGIGVGDEVIVTPRSFIASASSIVLRGLKPVFADVDPVSQNITAETIGCKITSRTKAILLVHLAGWPCDMDSILSLAQKKSLYVIEDCAQAHGAEYKGRLVGSFGHVAAFSFCQDKIISTGGEGGMITTNDRKIWSKVWSYKDHGKCYEAVYNANGQPGFKWVHESIGTNFRMTEMQSSIGRIQLRKVNEWIEIRRRNADILNRSIMRIPELRTTVPPSYIRHAYYKYYTFIRPDMLAAGWDRERIMNTINAEGIPCFSGSCSEIYQEKAFDHIGVGRHQKLQVAEELGKTSLMFLVHPTLSEKDIEDTAKAIGKVMVYATRK